MLFLCVVDCGAHLPIEKDLEVQTHSFYKSIQHNRLPFVGRAPLRVGVSWSSPRDIGDVLYNTAIQSIAHQNGP
jgi:hypothetical protein